MGLGLVGDGATSRIRAQIAGLCVLLVGCGIASDCVGTPAFMEAKRSADDIAPLVAQEAEGAGGEAACERAEVVYRDTEAKRTEEGSSGAKAYGAAFAMMNMAYAAGSMCGPLVGGAVMQGVGWRGMAMGTGVVCVVCAGVRWGVGMRGKRKRSGVEDGREGDS